MAMAVSAPRVVTSSVGQGSSLNYAQGQTPVRMVYSSPPPAPTTAYPAQAAPASTASVGAPNVLHPAHQKQVSPISAAPVVAGQTGGAGPVRVAVSKVPAPAPAVLPGQGVMSAATAPRVVAVGSQPAQPRPIVVLPQQHAPQAMQGMQAQPLPGRSLPAAAPQQPATLRPSMAVAQQPRPVTVLKAQAQAQAPALVPTVGQSHSLQLAISRISRENADPDQRLKAYRSLLTLLDSRSFFDNLPLDDASGRLRIAGPFCHDFFEAPQLLPFLVEKQCLEGEVVRGACKGIDAFGADLHPQETWWSAWEAWAKETYPKGSVTLKLQAQDLAQVQLPKSGLVMGLHPEVTNGGPWPAILKNALDCRLPGGHLVFATFYQHEANETKRVCEGFGEACEILENPFYAGEPPNSVGTFLRFAVLVAPRDA